MTARAGLDDIMTRFRFRKDMPKEHKYLASGIHELRYRERNNEYRLLFAVWGNFLVALDAFYKDTEKTDFGQAAKRWAAWQARNGKQPPP
ncbi:type II toxin-antitoxin system RelE/ParE family toxin [Humibacillus xanthopallidus]|uniref:type II toxin-antitoxin system RelE/ParE family toxin n=1 Tax=Humibacillus xanthopallidus TaxID=412689 RepID=UPI00384B035C